MKKMLKLSLAQVVLVLAFIITLSFLHPEELAPRLQVGLPCVLILHLLFDYAKFHLLKELWLPDTLDSQPIKTEEENQVDYITFSFINLSGLLGIIFWLADLILYYLPENFSPLWQIAIALLVVVGLTALLAHETTAGIFTRTAVIQPGATAVLFRGGKRINACVNEGTVVFSRLNIILGWTIGSPIKTTGDVQTFSVDATTREGVTFTALVTAVVDRNKNYLPYAVALGGEQDDRENHQRGGGVAELRQLELDALSTLMVPYFAGMATTYTGEDGQIQLAPGVLNGGTIDYGALQPHFTPSERYSLTKGSLLIYNGVSKLSLPITLYSASGKAVEEHKQMLQEIYLKALEVARENQDFKQLLEYDTEDFRKRYGALSSWFVGNIMGYDTGPMPPMLGLASELRDGLVDVAKTLAPVLVQNGKNQTELDTRITELERQLKNTGAE